MKYNVWVILFWFEPFHITLNILILAALNTIKHWKLDSNCSSEKQMCSFWWIWQNAFNFLHPHLYCAYHNRPFPDSGWHQIGWSHFLSEWIKRLVFLWDDVRQLGDTVTDWTSPWRLLEPQATTQRTVKPAQWNFLSPPSGSERKLFV